MINLLEPTQIIKSKRKSISLVIKSNGEFIVRAPIKSSDASIVKFIKEKSNWVIKKRTESIVSAVSPFEFNGLDKMKILDKTYIVECGQITRVFIDKNKIIVPNADPKTHLISFLKKTAKKYIAERVKLISSLFNFTYNSISITSAKTCWGSCGFNNKLHFSYRLIMCPTDVVDYVVLHELCHTQVKNHSNKFWQLVASCNPYYKNHEKWLKKNRAIMDLI